MRRSAGTHGTKLRPVVALAVVCAFALSPVEYRGGAERPHFHSPFQLWYDVAEGALHHHGVVDADGGAATASSVSGGVVAADAAPDPPRLSALASAERTAPILVVGVAAAWAVGSIRSRPIWPAPIAWSGLPFCPEPPPPRPVAAFS